MPIINTTEQLGKADALLKEADKRLEEHRTSLDMHNYVMAQGLLTIAKDHRAGLEDKNMFGQHRQAQTYLDKAQETHRKIKELISGLY